MRHLREPTFWPLAAALVVLAAIAGAVFLVKPIQPGPAAPLSLPRADTSPQAARPSYDVCSFSLAEFTANRQRGFHSDHTQIVEVEGIAIVSTAETSSRAFRVAEETVRRVFAHNDLEQSLADAGAYVVIVPAGKTVLDMPEFRCLRGQEATALEGVCGVADAAGGFPIATVEERDLLGDRRGPCRGLNILFHELGHLVDTWALGPQDYFDVRYLYADAMAAGMYAGEYAATNSNEYFAEGTQAFFASVDPAGRRDREWLRRYDPGLYDLLAAVYGEP